MKDFFDSYGDYFMRGLVGLLLIPLTVILVIASPIALIGWIGEKVYDWWKGF